MLAAEYHNWLCLLVNIYPVVVVTVEYRHCPLLGLL